MAGPETTTDGEFYSYNVLAPGETPVRPDSGGLVMSERPRVVEYGAASIGVTETAREQR